MDPHCPQCQILIDSEKRQMNKYKVCHDAFESAMVLNDTLAARVQELEAELGFLTAGSSLAEFNGYKRIKKERDALRAANEVMREALEWYKQSHHCGVNNVAEQALAESAAILETRTKEKG